MSDPIVSRARMRNKGRQAFLAGESRDSHYMNWHAPALVDWHTGFDEAAAEATRREEAIA